MSDNQEHTVQQWLLQICQQNTNRSLESQIDLLKSLKQNEYDLCLIQEPYIDFKGETWANQKWVSYTQAHITTTQIAHDQ